MQVQEIMTPGVEVVDPSTTIREAARIMRLDNIGALPVGENDRLIGIVTDRDIVVRALAEERSVENTTVGQVMSEGVFYCFNDDDVEKAAHVMSEHQVRRLPVLDRRRRLIGVIALADLAQSGTDAAKTALEGISEPAGGDRR